MKNRNISLYQIIILLEEYKRYCNPKLTDIYNLAYWLEFYLNRPFGDQLELDYDMV